MLPVRRGEVEMRSSEFIHSATDGRAVHVRRWLPDGTARAILLVAHGMAEHSARYARLAASLTASGWAVYAPDHRGHGLTAAQGGLGRLDKAEAFARIRDDLREVGAFARAEQKGLPLFLLGHSMGSLVVEGYMKADASDIGGCVLSGPIMPPSPALRAFGSLMARLGAATMGRDAPARLLHSLTFGANNKYFEPARTEADWLSRDGAEVDAYLADPLCGFVCSYGFYGALFAALSALYRGRRPFARVRKDLPVLILAGAEDPLGGAHGFVARLSAKLKEAGLQGVETRLYPGARHEILNETNRDEVVGDIAAWLEARLGRA
jgi:alpha-beta hydrolase superfamily lysophospholipase